jgi:phospholipase/carboxylesterase
MLLADLETIVVGAESAHRTLVVLLHGYAMRAADLAPFGSSLGVPALYLFPEGPFPAEPTGQTWWPIDTTARNTALRAGPRDLALETPAGLPAARARLDGYIAACRDRFKPVHLVVGGFSQGGMLACDWHLHYGRPLDGLLLYSASRLNLGAWQDRRGRLKDLPVLVSHGQQDLDLAFSAGEHLRDFAVNAEAQVTWVNFDGGHQIPLMVWRATRKFLRGILV